MTTGFKFRETHASGRFDQSVALFDDEVDFYLGDGARNPLAADALKVTEVDKDARARVLQRPGFDAIWGNKGPRDDCGIVVRKDVFEVLYEETYTVSHDRYRNERGNMTDSTEAAFQVVKAPDGSIGVLGSLHAPHGMGPELRARRVRSDVARAYVSITKGYIKRARRLMRKFKATWAALSGDFNLNFRLAWVRAYAQRAFRGWRMNWTGRNLSHRGTHGGSIIDGTLLLGLWVVGTPRVLRSFRGNDHTAYTEVLTNVNPKRRR